MKLCTFPYQGKSIPLYYDTEDKDISIVINEVFSEECYKKGLDWIKPIKKPIVLDIGAYVGDTALYFSQKKDATIYALEPCKSNFSCLYQTTKNLKNVKLFNLGLLSGNGMLKLDLGEHRGSGGESIFGTKNKSEEVKITDLEYFMQKTKLDHIDLMKIDVEGAEYEIFSNPQFERVNSKIDAIIGESHLEPCLPYVLPKLLGSYGYQFEWLPYENMNYGWNIKVGNYVKRVDIKLPTLFWAHR
jgi:FkbM family methyltransferase